jgi:succinate dehydrogenase / fumarate reductase cytochrome b subunit
MNAAPKQRPKYYDLNLAHLPAAGVLSIFHRMSGALLFLAIPVFLSLLQGSLGTEADYQRARAFLAEPWAKLVAIGFIWLYAHHFLAGIRYLLLDVHMGVSRQASSKSAVAVLCGAVLVALVAGWGLW